MDSELNLKSMCSIDVRSLTIMMVITKTIIIIQDNDLMIGASSDPVMGTCKSYKNLAPSLAELRVWLEGGREQ